MDDKNLQALIKLQSEIDLKTSELAFLSSNLMALLEQINSEHE